MEMRRLEKFEQKFEPVPEAGCWVWTACLSNVGYGKFSIGGGEWTPAHRFSYEAYVGPIPKGMQIDHLCRVRCCVNPAHLEPVTPKENTQRAFRIKQRRTHCPRGHAYPAAVMGKGLRCLICDRATNRRSYYKHRERLLSEKRAKDRAAVIARGGKPWKCS